MYEAHEIVALLKRNGFAQVAWNPVIADFPDLPQMLANDDDVDLRATFARNPILAQFPEIIEHFSQDETLVPQIRDFHC